MTIELGAILSLAGLVIALFAWLRQDTHREINGLRDEIRREFMEVKQHIQQLQDGQSELRERMTHLEGLLDGLREATASQVA